MSEPVFPIEGGCNCDLVRYTMLTRPLVVSACHCTRCQKRTGGAFGITALIESDCIQVTSSTYSELALAVALEDGGTGDLIYARCSRCLVNLWYTFEAEGGHVKFVRVSTLDRAKEIVPHVHIWTKIKAPWVQIPDGVLSFEEGYEDREAVWEKESLERQKFFGDKQRAFYEKWMEGEKKSKEGELSSR